MKGVLLKVGLILLLAVTTDALNAQTFVLKPAELQGSDGGFSVKLLIKRDKVFRLTWLNPDESALNLNGANAKLLIGRTPNDYDVLSENISGTNAQFIADNLGLTPGRYYARITNSTNRTTSEIQADFENDPNGIIYSNEIQLLIEANEAPAITAPRGTINNSSPIFQWTAVSGVPSYWLILSSTPFDIVEDENGEVAIEGATIVWQYITKNTTANYGDINYQSPFTDEAPPLNSGQEYSYTILNVYEENNPGYTSPVFGGIVPFTYFDPNAVPVTSLIEPVNEEVFFSEETITFSWDEVPEATNYTINLLQIVKQQGIDVTIPIWTSTTTNSLIEYPALDNLKNGRYQWNVTTNNNSGGGSTSNSRFFTYEVETGEFAASIRSSEDNSILLGVELSARAVSGGVTPSIPYFVQNSTHYDSLVAGTYEFTATKEGFESGSGTHTIRDDAQTRFTIELNPLPSTINGLVVDENGDVVPDAQVNISGIGADFNDVINTDINGEFSISLNQGSYNATVSKSGYISADEQSVTVGLNEQKAFAESFTLINDEATVSGYVFNEDGEPIQRAKVRIQNNEFTYEVNTNGDGLYQFTVASGEWLLSSEKVGFVKPSDQQITLSTGDVLQNQDFVLTGNANQVTGFVREQITNSDGTVGTSIFEGVEVKAIPNVGEPISTITGRNGQYTLSLKSGSYTIEAIEDNYTSNEERELVIGIAVGETISGMDFELIPNPSAIAGTVTLPDGNGVADALVSIRGVGSVETSGSGFYEISVPEGEHEITVTKTGLVSPEPRTISVAVGQELTGVDFQMTPNAGTVSGRITAGGEALSNVRLTARNTATGSITSITNNLNGSYSFNLNSGSWYIRATKSGFISDSTEVLTVGPGQQLVNQNLVLVENLTTLRGTVTDGTAALRNARVTITKPNDATFEQSTVTQVNGTFAFSLPAGETYSIRSTKDGYKSASSTTNELVAGTTVVSDFALDANPSSVAGKVTVDGGDVLSKAKVIAINSNGNAIDSTESSTNGNYLLGLDPGNYTLRVKKSGYTRTETSTSLSIGQNLTGIDLDVDENFAFINGTITDGNGSGIEQAFISLQKQGGNGASAISDQEGNFNISRLTTGTFTIEISKTGFVTIKETFELQDGDFLSFNRQLDPKNGSISGSISDENGLILSDATVTATNTEGVTYTAISDLNGEYTINAVEPSSYSVNAALTGYTTASASSVIINLDNLNATDVDVANLIPNNGVIQGRITNVITGDPIKDVQLSANGSRGSGFAITGANGQFEITNLIPADYTLISSKDGFKSDTITVTIDPGNPTLVSNSTLLQNNGTIVGTITDAENQVLPFRVTVIASSDTETFTTQTNDVGEFAFEGVETGVSYSIETDIYREGYENTSTEIDVPLGADEVSLGDNLEVIVKQGTISGNAGINAASVKLLNADTRQIINLANSNTSGAYQFEFLEAGRYRVVANRLGYVFSPDTTSVIVLGGEESNTQNFSAQANIGSISVLANNANGVGQSNVNVTIVSADTTVILSKKTGANGVATFSNIKAGTDYTVRASKSQFTSDPETRNVALNSGDSTSVSFQILANAATISGNVLLDNGTTTSNLRNVDVAATLNSTGQSFSASTNQSGAYTIANLPTGTYTLIAEREGFTKDTVTVVVSAGATATANDLILNRASVDVRGIVRYKGDGVQGISVEAISGSSFNATTNSSGQFRFSTLPVKTGASDTTTYQVRIKSGLFTKSYTLSLTADDIGQRRNVPTTNLPSGQVNLLVTDGVNPLEGAILEFGISGGESNEIVTGSDGSFSSDDNLRKATYVVAVSKSGFLIPKNTIRISLPSDTTIIENEVVLPFRQLVVNRILADEETPVRVINPSGYDNSGVSGNLFYKRASQTQFQKVAMVQSGDTLSAFIPAINSTEQVTFYTSIDDTNASNTFVSNQRTITPLASGILTNVRLTPSVNGQTLRVGETYNLQLLVRDGVNKSLADKFVGENALGNISVSNLSDTTGIELAITTGTSIRLKALKSGTYKVRATAILNGSNVATSVSFSVSDIPLQSILVNAPAKQLDNAATHVFSYSAIDTSGKTVLLGESLEWNIKPSNFGTIDNRGVFVPTSNSFLGSFIISASDSVSGLIGSTESVDLVANVKPDEAYTLINGGGLELQLPAGSVDFTSRIALTETNPPPSKKFVFAQGSDQSYTVGDRIYVLSFSGSELKSSAQLTLPTDTTISELNNGEREIARFNFTTLQWEVFSDIAAKNAFSELAGTVTTERLGQFAVLAANEPLGIRNAAVLPSPFSPDIAPVKIGYWLDTAFPPAKVTIKIFNIRGELVRTLLENDLQQPGRYGSQSSTKEILWDGLTDAGNMARNGRYVVQISAKDQQGEDVQLLQVILIK
ncbi:MAG: carboxypeptidase regulatory-like domain-containing protein [Balneolaceae bacterium]|nr:carboxypeptidase regulatory-like domain-containing protein [Balneolaceae bacterium]